MIRSLSAAFVAATLGLSIGFAQDIVPVNHGPHHGQVVVEGGACATGNCGTCSDCVRITEIKKTQHPVYSCKVKEVCVPNCGLFGLFGKCEGSCSKIEVRQLVKKYRTDEECVSKCVTAEEAAKHYEAEAKKAADKAKESAPKAPAPAKLPAGAVSEQYQPGVPVSVNPPRQPFAALANMFGRN